jgi:hypothetical protein
MAGGSVGRLSYGGDGTRTLIFLAVCDEEGDGALATPKLTPSPRTQTRTYTKT